MGIGSITSDRRGVAPTLRQAGSSRLSRFPCVQIHHAISKGALRPRTFRGRGAPFFAAPRTEERMLRDEGMQPL